LELSFKRNVLAFTVLDSNVSMNVAESRVSVDTHVDPFVGEVEVTVGGVVSGAAAVVKVQVYGVAKVFPATSLTAVDTVAVYWVDDWRLVEGVKVAS